MKASILPVFVAATLISAVAGQDYFFIEGQDTPLIGYSSDIYVQRDDNNCTTIINNYNHLVHKPKYVVGVFSSEGDDIAFRNYNLTFGQYLTATAGQKIDPPVEFDMVAGSMTQLAEMETETRNRLDNIIKNLGQSNQQKNDYPNMIMDHEDNENNHLVRSFSGGVGE
ncbi:unknown protein [Seminavis robusta]|uniref:Uncharacterized protein n=1 Tax=Seminavis robusta TaxID=568900 RepID=A0A9N8EB08_9STRA|nr:unknown protein [Seminavis robusta]|eukprot:Sro703_g190130.1 n/a (168) ;mRNA; r:31782-32445